MTRGQRLLLAVIAAGLARGYAGTITNYTWLGGTGSWTDPAKWSTDSVPSCIASQVCNVFLNNPVQTSGVALGAPGASISSLTLNSLAALTVATGTLTLGNSAGAGQLTNQGTITLEDGASLVLDLNGATGAATIANSGQIHVDADTGYTASSFQIVNGGQNSSVTLSGTGSFVMGGGTISANALTNATTIEGGGTLNTLVLNQGTINNDSGGLTIYTGAGGLQNTGSIQAGNLTLDATSAYTAGAPLLTNSGTVTVNGAMTLQTFGPAGGAATINNTGTMIIGGSGLEFYDPTGQLTPGQATYVWNGNGTVFLNNGLLFGFYGSENLTIGSQQTFTGGGTLEQLNSIVNNGTIEGTGKLSITSNSLTNNGVLSVGGNSADLILNPGTLVNNGTLEAFPGTTLSISGALTNNGSLIFGNGSNVQLTGTLTNYNASTQTLQGGSYVFGGRFQSGMQPVLTLEGANVTLQGQPVLIGANSVDPIASIANIDSAGSLTFSGVNYGGTAGSLTNAGTLTVNNGSVSLAAQQFINSGTTNITDNGVLNLGGAGVKQSSLRNAPTVVNQGTLTVDQATLTITAAGENDTIDGGAAYGLHNTGAINVQNGGTLNIVIPSGFAPSVSTSLVNDGAFTVSGGATLSIQSSAAATNLSLNQPLGLNGGTLQLAGSGQEFSLAGGVTLSGAGSRIAGATGAELLLNFGAIQGAGEISNLSIGNENIVEAQGPSGLLIQPASGGLTNDGTLLVDAGSHMTITGGGGLTNFDSQNGVLSGGTYDLSGPLQLGGGNVAGLAGATVTLRGAGGFITPDGATNGLASLATIDGASSLTLASGASLTTNAGLQVEGTLSLTDSTLTVSGSLEQYRNASNPYISLNNSTLFTNGFSATESLQLNSSYAPVGGVLSLANNSSMTVTGNFVDRASQPQNGQIVTQLSGGSSLVVQGDYTITAGQNNALARTTLDGSSLTVTGTYTAGATNGAQVVDLQLTDGSRFSAGGDMQLQAGSSLHLTGAGNTAGVQGAFSNQGLVQVDAGSTLQLSGPFSNLNGQGVLNGGTYVLNGGLLTYNGGDIAVNNASVTLTGNGNPARDAAGSSILISHDGGVTSALNHLSENDSSLTLQNGAGQSIAGDFTNAGSLQLTASTMAIAGNAVNAPAGTLALQGAGNSITVGGSFTNQGFVQVDEGSTLKAGAWGNLGGTGALAGGTFVLGGTIQYAAPVTAITGLQATSLTLNGPGALITTDGSTQALASLTTVGSATLNLTNGANLALNGSLNNTGTITVDHSTFTTAGDLVNGTGGTFTVTGNPASGTAVQVGGNATNSGQLTVGNPDGAMAVAGSFTNNSGGTVQITNAPFAAGSLTVNGGLTNNGTVLVSTGSGLLSSGTLTVSGNFVNGTGGLVQIGPSGLGNPALNATGFDNSGMLAVSGGGSAVLGGLTNRANGVIQVGAGGLVNITGPAGAFTNYNSATGTLDGGAYQLAGTLQFTGANILHIGSGANVTLLPGEWITPDGSTDGLAALASNAGSLQLEDVAISTSQSFLNTGQLTFAGDGGQPTSLQVEGGITNGGQIGFSGVDSQMSAAGDFFNAAGAINLEGANNNITVDGDFINDGGNFEMNGAETGDSLTAADIEIEAGTFSGAGTVTGDTTVTGGTLHPGNSPGILTITGDYLQSGGVLQIDILSAGTPGVDYSQLDVTGDAFLGGTLELEFLNGFAPGAYEFLVAGGALSGGVSSVDIEGATCPYCIVSFGQAQHGMIVDVEAGSPTPEPATGLPVAAGLLFALWPRRRPLRHRLVAAARQLRLPAARRFTLE